MLPPTEDRLHIEVGKESKKEWLQNNISTASQNYKRSLSEHIQHLKQKLDAGELDSAEVERTIVNCMPRDAPNRWFGTGGGLVRIARVENRDMFTNSPLYLVSRAIERLVEVDSPVALIGDDFLPMIRTIHHWGDSEDNRIEDTLEILEAPRLSDNWGDFLTETKNNSASVFYELVIEKYLLNYSYGGCMSASNPRHFAKMVNDNWDKAKENGDLDRLSEILVDGICTNLLDEGWDERTEELLRIKCIITEDEKLETIPNFIDTNARPELVHILPSWQLIADEAREETIKIISDSKVPGIADAVKPSGTRILKLIDQDTRLNPEVHDDLESHEEVHKAVSMLLRCAFDNRYNVRNNLDDDEVRELRYVPCRRHGRVVTLQNNIVNLETRYGSSSPGTWNYGELSSSNLTMSSLYHREFIFAERTDSLDALPDCITDRLRFLALHEDVVPNLVRKDVLNLNGVGEGAKMTNLVRTLLFEHELGGVGLAATQPSLFRKGVLEEWLRQPPMHLGTAESDSDERVVEFDSEEVKRQLIVTLLSPYGDKISGGLGVKGARDIVELVLGADGEWRTGNSYCMTLDSSLDDLIDDMAAVDDEFASSLSDGILKQLGLKDSLGPHSAKPAIETRLDDEDALALLMLSLLSSEQDWSDCGNDNDEEAWDELCELAWVPTNGAGVLLPSQVLYPSEGHVALLGEEYTHFPPKSTWEELRQANHKARSRDLGMRWKVDLGVLILAMCGEHTSSNDVSAAAKELSSRLLKLDGAPQWSALNWGPHPSVSGLEIKLNDNSTINSQDGLWVTENFDKAQVLGQLFNDMDVVAIDQLSHIDRSTIDGIRKLGILQAGPEWPEILQRLTEVETPQLVEGLWDLLTDYEDTPSWKEMHGYHELFDGDSDVNFCLDGEVVVIHESILITNNPDEHSRAELDGRVRYYVDGDSIEENWFELLGVERASRVKPGDYLRTIVGEFIDPYDEVQETRLAGAKALMAECDDGFYAPVWVDAEIQIVDLGVSLAIHPGPDPNAIRPQFRVFPIIHRAQGDPASYIDWVDDLRHNNLTPFSDISSILPEPVLENYRVHPPLQDAIKQVMEALSKIHPAVFNDPSIAKITCRIGRGGVPSYMTAEWEGEQVRILHSSSRSGCFYEEEDDELTMFVDEDDDHGNEPSCSHDLVEGLLRADWYPELSERIEEDGGFSYRLKSLIKSLLETPTDEWKYLELNGKDYGSILADDDWEVHSRLFESHSQYQMTQLLKGWYGGCQICGLVTPAGEYGDDTKESLIQTIRVRGSHYHGPTDPSRPRGRQLWLCPRHRILWGRRLVRFSFMDQAFDGRYVWRETLPEDLRQEGIGLLEGMRDNWEEGEDMMVEVFDQSVDGFGQAIEPQWNSNPMRVTKEHAMAIINEMIGWISS